MPSRDDPLAAFASVLLDLLLGAMLLFGWIAQVAPPQDLPWKPLRLSDPIGLATRAKLLAVTSSPDRCLAFLRHNEVRYTAARSPAQSGPCVVAAPLRLPDALSPKAPLMACPLAATYLIWEAHAVQPAAQRWLGASVRTVDHAGTYACRGIRSGTTARVDVAPSQHAGAEAIDVTAFEFSDGRKVTVGRDWSGAGAESRFLHEVRGSACKLFHTTLSPDYNAAHRTHLHMDMGGISVCR